MESTDPADPDEGLERVALARGLLSAEQAGELRAARQAAGEPLRLAQQLLRSGLVDGPQLADLLRNAGRAPRRLGRYELLREIGRGGMGVVYEALDPTLGRSVAIKLLVDPPGGDSVPIERLRREAQLAGQLSHPGIINVHEVAEQLDDQTGERMTYIVMDHVRGPTLAELWETLSFERRIELLRQIASAMAEAHRGGVIHRDLKPDNILVSGDRAIVTDFGLARGDTPSTQLTCSDAVLGTPAYMSPEQVLGHNDRLDARTDVWSLGVMLYLLVTGVTPFRGNSRSTQVWTSCARCGAHDRSRASGAGSSSGLRGGGSASALAMLPTVESTDPADPDEGLERVALARASLPSRPASCAPPGRRPASRCAWRSSFSVAGWSTAGSSPTCCGTPSPWE